ncbi:MAG: carbon storage regulator CsrA [Firmicutes bacterium]|nr:carbon storage regulator CsrA [Bacillota bacterium]
MLVLARKKDESILIGDNIEIIITDITEDKVKIGIEAPRHMKIFRKELLEQIQDENIKSAGAKVDISALRKTKI